MWYTKHDNREICEIFCQGRAPFTVCRRLSAKNPRPYIKFVLITLSPGCLVKLCFGVWYCMPFFYIHNSLFDAISQIFALLHESWQFVERLL